MRGRGVRDKKQALERERERQARDKGVRWDSK